MLFNKWWKILLILLLMLIYTCIGNAHADIILENTGKEKLIAYVYWKNHPYGCYYVRGIGPKCNLAVAVGEMNPGKVWKVLEGYFEPGRTFVIVFQRPTYLDDGFIYMQEFTVTENLAQVYMNQNAFGLAWK